MLIQLDFDLNFVFNVNSIEFWSLILVLIHFIWLHQFLSRNQTHSIMDRFRRANWNALISSLSILLEKKKFIIRENIHIQSVPTGFLRSTSWKRCYLSIWLHVITGPGCFHHCNHCQLAILTFMFIIIIEIVIVFKSVHQWNSLLPVF